MKSRLKWEYEAVKRCLALAKKAGVTDSEAVSACKMTMEDLVAGKIGVDEALERLYKLFGIKPEVLLREMYRLHKSGVRA